MNGVTAYDDMFVSDTAQHEILRLTPDGETVVASYGGPGVFTEPRGVLRLPRHVTDRTGDDVLVADSGTHEIKGLRLSDGRVRTLAGTGRRLVGGQGSGPALKQALSEPWGLAWWIGRVVIAMAGTHQLCVLHLAQDPGDNTLAVLAGTGLKGHRDGAAHDARLSRPSRLEASGDGSRVWVLDAGVVADVGGAEAGGVGGGDAGGGVGGGADSIVRSVDLTDEGFVVRTHPELDPSDVGGCAR